METDSQVLRPFENLVAGVSSGVLSAPEAFERAASPALTGSLTEEYVARLCDEGVEASTRRPSSAPRCCSCSASS